jgi:hypothetical protein
MLKYISTGSCHFSTICSDPSGHSVTQWTMGRRAKLSLNCCRGGRTAIAGHATMTLTLKAVDHEDLCHGWSWEIHDEDQLVEDVARVALGQYRHVERILAGVTGGAPVARAEHVADARAKLSVDPDGSPYRRDGWVFQVISWIAAHQCKGASIVGSTGSS